MALVPKDGIPSLSSMLPPQNCQIGSGKLAGEDIAAGDVCYLAADGTIMRSIGTTLGGADAKADGIAARDAKAGEAVTLFRNVTFRYGANLTPGRLYVAAVAGGLDTAATTGGTAPVGFVVDATRIYFHGSFY